MLKVRWFHNGVDYIDVDKELQSVKWTKTLRDGVGSVSFGLPRSVVQRIAKDVGGVECLYRKGVSWIQVQDSDSNPLTVHASNIAMSGIAMGALSYSFGNEMDTVMTFTFSDMLGILKNDFELAGSQVTGTSLGNYLYNVNARAISRQSQYVTVPMRPLVDSETGFDAPSGAVTRSMDSNVDVYTLLTEKQDNSTLGGYYDLITLCNGFDGNPEDSIRAMRFFGTSLGAENMVTLKYPSQLTDVQYPNTVLVSSLGFDIADVNSVAFGSSQVKGSGNAQTTIYSSAIREDLLKYCGYSAIQASFSNVSTQQVLDDDTESLIARPVEVGDVVSFTASLDGSLIPVCEHTSSEVALWVGDYVRIVEARGFDIMRNPEQYARVVKIDCSYDENGAKSISLDMEVE